MTTGNEAAGCSPADLHDLVTKAIYAGSAIEIRCRLEETWENYDAYVREAAREHFGATGSSRRTSELVFSTPRASP